MLPARAVVGRNREWSMLQAATASTETSVAVMIEGPVGVGKTYLLHEALDAAADHDPPREPLLVRPTAADLDRLTERLAAANRPALVAVDDLHLLHDADVWRLCALIRQHLTSPVVWLLARRPTGPRLLDHRLPLVDISITHVSLDRLVPDACAEIAADMFGLPPDDGLAAVLASASGDPLLFTELAAGLREEDLVDCGGERARLRRCQVPQRTVAAVAHRLAPLSPEARRTLVAAATIGVAFDAAGLATMADTTAAGLLVVLEELVSHGLLVRDLGADDALSFRHPLVMRVMRDHMPRGLRKVLSQELAVVRGGHPHRPRRAGVDKAGVDGAGGPERGSLADPGGDSRGPVLSARGLEAGAGIAPPTGDVRPSVAPAPSNIAPAPSNIASALSNAGSARSKPIRSQPHGTTAIGHQMPPWPELAGARVDDLSPIEQSIAWLVAAGLTNQQVARQVHLSPHTVNYHLRGLFRKLGISSRVALARLATTLFEGAPPMPT